jgi:LysM repeat protein
MNFYQKRYILIFILILSNSVLLFADNKKVAEDSVSIVGSILRPIVGLSDSIVKFGKTFINTPYRFGSQSGLSFDCSGFTSFVYNSFGYKLEHSSSGQASQYPEVDTKQLKTGDLVYFSGHRRSKKHIGHVGMVVSVDDDGKFNFIHAATSKGITISSSEEPYYKQRFIKANRVIGYNPFLDGGACLKKENLAVKAPIPFSNNVVQTTKIIPARYHSVKRGETLKSIAKQYGISEKMLLAMNHIKGKKLKKKQLLKVTEQESVLVAENAPKINTTPTLTNADNNAKAPAKVNTTDAVATIKTDKPTNKTHVLQKGETLFGIAAKYGLTVGHLMELNNLKKPNVQAGQELVVTVTTTNELARSTSQALANDRNSDSKKVTTPTTHEVKKGETLFSIAAKYNVDSKALCDYNKLTDAKIYAGQTLQLPSTDRIESTKNTPAITKTPQKIYHKVRSGETLTSIAQRYGCSVDEIKSWNKRAGKKLLAGVKLKLFSNYQ